MNLPRSISGARAFTLIEMILAIGIMAIVLLVINTAFFSAVQLRQRAADAVDASQPVQQALTVMRRDLVCAVAPYGPLTGDFKAGSISEQYLGRNAALEIYTTTGALHEDEPWGDVQKVTYELKDPASRNSSGGKDLVRSVTRNLLSVATPDVQDQWLMSGVQKLNVECFDGTQWVDNWDTTAGNTNLPAAVRVSIQLAGSPANEPITLVAPVLAQAATNQLQTVASAGD
jgi:type II secretion system protein J